MLSKPVCRWIVLCVSVAACAVATAAASVTELKPSEMAAFVARHEYVVVQMTSPEWKCTYCVGADRTFDQASVLRADVPMAFARVQWSPWSNIPDFGPLVEVLGVPTHYVFRRGKVMGEAEGRQDSALALIARINAIVRKGVVAKTAGSEEIARSTTLTRSAGDSER
jgi:hypothetical protein